MCIFILYCRFKIVHWELLEEGKYIEWQLLQVVKTIKTFTARYKSWVDLINNGIKTQWKHIQSIFIKTVSTHRLINAWVYGSEHPAHCDGLSGHGASGSEGALQLHICPVDCFHLLWSVNFYSTDMSHPCDKDKRERILINTTLHTNLHYLTHL